MTKIGKAKVFLWGLSCPNRRAGVSPPPDFRDPWWWHIPSDVDRATTSWHGVTNTKRRILGTDYVLTVTGLGIGPRGPHFGYSYLFQVCVAANIGCSSAWMTYTPVVIFARLAAPLRSALTLCSTTQFTIVATCCELYRKYKNMKKVQNQVSWTRSWLVVTRPWVLSPALWSRGHYHPCWQMMERPWRLLPAIPELDVWLWRTTEW